MAIDYTPEMKEYSNQGKFRYWVQMVLPTIYDDSLSYMELLNKVVYVINLAVEDVDAVEDNVTALLTAFQELQEYTNDYFDNLDVQEEINHKLDEMVESGAFDELIKPLLADPISEWLEEHITPTTPVIDNSLTVSGAAADAKVTGDYIRFINKNMSNYNSYNIVGIRLKSITSHGINFTSNGDGSYTVSGTATARASYNLIDSPSTMPDGFIPGKPVTIYYNGYENVQIQMFKYVNGIATSFVSENGDISDGLTVVIPNDAEGLNVRLSVPSGTTISDNIEVTPIVLYAKSNKELENDNINILERLGDTEEFIEYNKDNNSYNIIPIRKTNLTASGITFTTNNDGTYDVVGTATARASYNLIDSPTSLPDGIEAGKPIILYFNGYNKIQVQVYKYVSNTASVIASILSDVSTGYEVLIPEDAEGVNIRISVPGSTSIPTALRVEPIILYAKSNKILEKEVEIINEYNVKNEFNIRNTNLTTNGISFKSNKDGSYVINGTATSRASYNLFESENSLPDWLEAGKPVTIYYNGYDKVSLQFFKWVNGVAQSSTFISINGDYSDGFTAMIPVDATGVTIRLSVPNGTIINSDIVVKPTILNKPKAVLNVPIRYCAFGDSLTLSAVWDDDPSTHWYQCDLINQIPTRIANAIGCNNFANYGVGGSRFVQQQEGDDIIGDMVKSVDLSGCDLVTLGGGGNDRSTTLGDGDTATRNDGTICGAVIDIFEYLNEINPELQIIMYGVSPMPLPTQTEPEYIYTRVFGGGWSLNDYYREMRKLCKRYGVGFIDWYDCTLILQWGKLSGGYSENLRNWAHPKNQNIYKQLGNYLGGKVASIYKG